MEKVLLKSIAKQVRGVSYKPEDISKENVDSYIPLLRAGNIGTSDISNLDDLVYVRHENVAKHQYLQEGDILIAASSGSIEIVGKSVYIEKNQGYTFGAFCKVVRPNSELVNPKYVSFYFQTDYYRKKISNLAQGANINNLKNEHIDNLEIPLPDLETQNKIVAILDKAKTLLDKREKTIGMYDELLRATFLEMFGNPMERPSRWAIDNIGNNLNDITAGSSYGGENKKAIESDELGVLKVSAVTKGIFDPSEYKAVKRNVVKREIVTPRRGDLLFSRANTLELVGATCIVHEDYEDLILPDKLWKVETNEDKLRKVYLHYVMRHKDVRNSFLSIATGSSGSMLNISMDKFRAIEIPVPPIELQMRFEKQYLKYIDIRKKLLMSIDYIYNLKSALSNLAFSGELKLESGIDLEVLLEWDFSFFKSNIEKVSKNTIQQLIERLDKSENNKPRFYESALYDKVKSFILELLKQGKLNQVFDKQTKSVKLTVA